MYSNQKPTEFICLLLKLLQIQPEKEILIEYLQVDEFKSVYLPQILESEVATIPPAEGLLFAPLLQVSSRFGCNVHTDDLQGGGSLRIVGAASEGL